MTTRLFFLLLLLGSRFVHAQHLTLEQSTLVVASPPFAECHAATIESLPAGRLAAAWFAGSRESNPDVVIWFATWQNDQWAPPRIVADGIVNDTLRYPCWNPVLYRNKSGKLLLFYKVGKNPRSWWGMLKTSEDEGKSWSAAVRLPDGQLGPIKNKPIRLRNGSLLHPSSTESLDEKTWHIHLETSDEYGRHWSKISPDNSHFGVIQPTILRHSKRKLQILCRSRHNFIVQAWSADEGKTWGPLSLLNVPNPNAGFDAVTTKSGIHILVHNPTSMGKHWSDGRNKLVVSSSRDSLDWKTIYVLEDATSGEFSYPAIIQSPDGLLHILYTMNRKNIRHVVLSLHKSVSEKHCRR